MTKSNRGLAVVIMAVILFATIFMIPVPAASCKPPGKGRTLSNDFVRDLSDA